MSETFQTLHHLVHKGVKVVMDIPYELWNETSAEVADMKKQCDVLLEEYEDVIEDWYHNHQQEDLTEFLCAGHVLGEQDRGCLYEEWSSKKGDNAPSKGNKKQNKGKERKKSRKETVQTKEELNVQKSQGSQDKDVTRNKASRDQDVHDGQASRDPVTPESQASEGQDIPKSHAPREKTPHTRANEEL